MSGKEEKKFQRLRSVTKSNAANKTSILVDASKYIEELKDKVEAAAGGASAVDSSSSSSSGSAAVAATVISVSSVDLDDNISNSSRRGFRINVSLERTRPGLLMSVLEAFEDLGLDVLDADVSCADDTAFRLQALGSGHQGQQQDGGSGSVDEQKVRQAVMQAITKCINDDDDE